MTRILIATGSFGGPATYSKLLVDKLPARGYIIRVADFGEVLRYPKIIRHFVYFFKLFFKSFGTDIVYAQDPVSVGLPALLAAKIARRRFFLKIVGDYAWEQGVQRFGVKELLDEFVAKNNYPLSVRFFRHIERFVGSRAEKIIVPSFYLKGVVEKWGLDPNKIVVIYNAVSVEKIGDVPESVRRMPKPIVVTVGRLVSWKGIDGLIRVFDGVWAARREGIDASLVIVGRGPEEKILKAHAEQLRIKDRCLFTGELSHEDTLAVIQEADILVLNSTYEGLSHTLIEALKLGLCIVATNAGGNPEIISSGEGILINVGDERQLGSSLKMLIEHQDKRAYFSSKAKESAKRFSEENMLKKLAAILR